MSPTGSCSTTITHSYDIDGNLVFCSEAKDFMHYWDDGTPPSLTGFGFCPHTPDDEDDVVVWIGFP